MLYFWSPKALRESSALDRLISSVDRGLRAATGVVNTPRRPNPAGCTEEGVESEHAARMVARLIRVDHAGEVAAQALYEGQALTARSAERAAEFREAAREEADHLAWCAERLDELGAKPSALGPLWFVGSFAIGVCAGTFGDRVSLGFLRETELQVERHLEQHLAELPAEDHRSRAILEQMRHDEAQHAQYAEDAGAVEFPAPVQALMHGMSRIMTNGAKWV